MQGNKNMEIMAAREIPFDVIFEILVRLPVKSLLRFKCVSKSWLSLISSPLFIKTHLHKHSSNFFNHACLIFSGRLCTGKLTQVLLNSAFSGAGTRETNLEIPEELTYLPIEILGSCNGLLYIAAKRDFGIWNPSIRKCKMLPRDQVLISLERPVLKKYGFGYDELNDDYKVVNVDDYLTTDRSFLRLNFMVYSTKRNSWRRIEEILNGTVSDRTIERYGTFLNGKIHWTMLQGTAKILTFDLANEKCGEIQVPETIRSSDVYWRSALGVSGDGCLLLACGDDPNSKTNLGVWIMKEYGAFQSWNKVASVVLEPPFFLLGPDRPVFISKNGEILLHRQNFLELYHRERGSSWKYRQNQRILWNKCLPKVDIYNESLVWLEGSGKTRDVHSFGSLEEEKSCKKRRTY